MNEKQEKMASVLERLQEAGGLLEGVSREVSENTKVPEAHVFGVGSFFHLLSDPEFKVRVCQGLTCRLAGSKELLNYAKEAGLPATGCSCLAACDKPISVLKDRHMLPNMTLKDIDRSQGRWEELESEHSGGWNAHIGPLDKGPEELANRLHLPARHDGLSFQRALSLGPGAVLNIVEESGLQGRGGAAFPAAIKWRAIRAEAETTRYVVLNADEAEPGTFTDREVMIRRPDTVLEGLAIAAVTVGAEHVYCYLRGEFDRPWRALTEAIAEVERLDLYPGIKFHMHAGHGAYICGEETALLEALEGKRGMPRLRPPYPTQEGLWGKPTLVHNVESIACVPAILEHGGAWFRNLGRTEPGTKLYSISGHVQRPGVYELPLGVSLDELVEAAGGYVGTLKAFSPGGASSGFLPASERNRPLGFKTLGEVGSMLGSAGVVVLNDTVNMVWAARQQLKFFEVESCGQCAPCRIGSRFLREQVDRFLNEEDSEQSAAHLAQVADVAWQMNEGSICGLGQTAPLPLTSAMRWFPEEFEHER